MDVSLEKVHDLIHPVTDMIAIASQVPGCVGQLIRKGGKRKRCVFDLIPKYETSVTQGKPLASVIISYCSIPKQTC
jgi:hypothetical protein